MFSPQNLHTYLARAVVDVGSILLVVTVGQGTGYIYIGKFATSHSAFSLPRLILTIVDCHKDLYSIALLYFGHKDLLLICCELRLA